MKILLVEDDFFNRRLLAKYLAPLGEVDIAVNGEEALVAVQGELAANSCYDLICLDIMMPKLDGQMALKAIRKLEHEAGIKRENGAKIFMTSALSDKDSVVQAAIAGCDSYLIKPITKSRILEEMEKHGLLTEQ